MPPPLSPTTRPLPLIPNARELGGAVTRQAAGTSGRSIAPVPWIDHICAARLLAELGALTDEIMSGNQIAALDAAVEAPTGARLIPAGSIADQIIVRDGEDIVLLSFGTRAASCRTVTSGAAAGPTVAGRLP